MRSRKLGSDIDHDLLYGIESLRIYPRAFFFECDFRDRAIPCSIPNQEVKSIIADNTAPFGCGNVGRCIKIPMQKRVHHGFKLFGHRLRNVVNHPAFCWLRLRFSCKGARIVLT